MEGIDCEEMFSPVALYTSICTIIALVASMGWKIHQMVLKTTFLKGEIDEQVYIEYPEGFVIYDEKTHVCMLKKSMYGLKQTRFNSRYIACFSFAKINMVGFTVRFFLNYTQIYHDRLFFLSFILSICVVLVFVGAI
jgi:hypothetical protein